MWRQERERASQSIQAWIRGLLRKWNRERVAAARVIQRVLRCRIKIRHTSAKVIQSCAQKWIIVLNARRNKAAATWWRQLYAKGATELKRKHRIGASLLADRLYVNILSKTWAQWTHLSRTHAAALHVQRMWRGRAARIALFLDCAASSIARCIRRYLNRVECERSRIIKVLAVNILHGRRRAAIVRAWRQKYLSARLEKRLKCQKIQKAFRTHHWKRCAAATTIATRARRLLARRKTATLREETAAMAALQIFASMHKKRRTIPRKSTSTIHALHTSTSY